jgi:hypothetical protein
MRCAETTVEEQAPSAKDDDSPPESRATERLVQGGIDEEIISKLQELSTSDEQPAELARTPEKQ